MTNARAPSGVSAAVTGLRRWSALKDNGSFSESATSDIPGIARSEDTRAVK